MFVPSYKISTLYKEPISNQLRIYAKQIEKRIFDCFGLFLRVIRKYVHIYDKELWFLIFPETLLLEIIHYMKISKDSRFRKN